MGSVMSTAWKWGKPAKMSTRGVVGAHERFKDAAHATNETGGMEQEPIMTFAYVGVEDAIKQPGLRMVVVGGVPSPWGEAAKGLLHIKRIDWAAVRLVYDSEALKEWAGERSGPIAIYDNEKPRSRWSDILLLAERLSPEPALLPKDPAERALAFGLAHELVGEDGLAWSRRIELIHAGLQNSGGFPERVSKYLAKKYGYSPAAGAAAASRVAELLKLLAARLAAQHRAGSRYYVGEAPTAVDVYSAACMAMFCPLPEAQCKMDAATRAAFANRDPQIEAALDPIVLAHRDMMYAQHLELPLAL
jgi:glutathione S-transferase